MEVSMTMEELREAALRLPPEDRVRLAGELINSVAAGDDVEADIAELRELSEASGGQSRHWTFDRDQLHRRS
jgi:hypothetical protein